MKKPKTAKERRELLFTEGNKAVRKAQEENRKKGIANVYMLNGKMIFQMPDGSVKTK